ncbi:hypothetical protein HELRODRAFT_161717 [Helobdella robusta]|uniref:Uncharacterized protein n=1 Tax=Helobdella robusta TaxID=6412 RepID=T1ERT9_HELRO|nr:hypothetical protein HELRODRAFT_161717 [Helobdella robusta]ESO02445.1 hypothetical protein HELRODRAFT_161717 [Helobdella robusta]
MEVVDETEERVCFASQPKYFNWALFIGIFSFGIALSFYSESCFWQMIYVIGSLVIASAFIDHWQELTLDRPLDQLSYTVQNIYQRFLFRNKHTFMETAKLSELKKVKANQRNGTITFYHNHTTTKVFVGSSFITMLLTLNRLKEFLKKCTADNTIQFDYNIQSISSSSSPANNSGDDDGDVGDESDLNHAAASDALDSAGDCRLRRHEYDEDISDDDISDDSGDDDDDDDRPSSDGKDGDEDEEEVDDDDDDGIRHKISERGDEKVEGSGSSDSDGSFEKVSCEDLLAAEDDEATTAAAAATVDVSSNPECSNIDQTADKSSTNKDCKAATSATTPTTSTTATTTTSTTTTSTTGSGDGSGGLEFKQSKGAKLENE